MACDPLERSRSLGTMSSPVRPRAEVLAAFGGDDDAKDPTSLVLLPGGRGLTWRAGEVVLRPSAGNGETVWKAEALATLMHSDAFRAPRPRRARGGSWTMDGWEAWEWMSGATDESRIVDVIRAGEAFHAAVAHHARPAFLDASDDPWAQADRIAWGERPGPANETLTRLTAAFSPVDAPSQVIHGDLLGNVMFDCEAAPVVIDWAPYWRPVHFATAIALADAACWHDLGIEEMREIAERIPDGTQLLIRALVFRIATFDLRGHWSRAMIAKHEPVVAAALG